MTSRSLRARSRYFWSRSRGGANHTLHRMRILIFHGYLLRGTGSNVYNLGWRGRSPAWGTRSTCSARTATGSGSSAGRRPSTPPTSAACCRSTCRTTTRASTPARSDDLSDAELEHYLDANVRAVREVAERVKPDVALANHLVMGPAILARALGGRGAVRGQGPRQRARVHGAARPRALPALRPRGARRRGGACSSGRATPARASGRSSARTSGRRPGSARPASTRRRSRPRPPAWRDLARRLEGVTGELGRRRRRRGGAAPASTRERDRIVSYVGKLIVSKGVDLLLAAWPLVPRAVPDARLIVVGFGAYRDGLERLRGGRGAGDLATMRARSPARARARGRPAGALCLPGGVPRRREATARASGGGARRLHRAARARGPARPAARLRRGPGRAEHVPRGVRHGRRRGGRLRRAAGRARTTPGSPRSRARSRPARDELRQLLTFERGPDAVRGAGRAARRLARAGARGARRGRGRAGALAHERYSLGGRGPRRDRRGAGRSRRATASRRPG